MSGRGEYHTRQKEAMSACLEAHAMEPMSADDFCALLACEGARVGRATAYRHLEALSARGEARKYADAATGKTLYQFVGAYSDCESHLHCQCVRCGAMLHVECDELDALGDHLKEAHGFLLDARRTALQGVCARCAAKKRP